MLLTLTLAAATLQPAPAKAAADSTTPPARLAARIAAVRQETTVAPVLVIVADNASYLSAVSRWHTDQGRVLYPVLIDTVSTESREDIARFVRAYKPARIIRYKAPGDTKPDAELTDAALTTTLYSTFGTSSQQGYLDTLAKRTASPGPLGAVATCRTQPGALAAVALAAAYGEALILTDPQPAPSATLTFADADRLTGTITKGLTDQKLPFAGLGDQIDALTLCYDMPMKVVAGNSDAPANPVRELACKPGEALALTDIIGRAPTGNRQGRWAFASQTCGNSAKQVYRAMSAIFLQPTAAAAFNGYEQSGEFGKYNPTDAIKTLAAAGLETTILDRPNQTNDNWRTWAAGGFGSASLWPKTAGKQPAGGVLDANLLLVNTMGNSDFFLLLPGKCYAGDPPFMNTPSVVHFIHSWSLQHGADPWAVGGRWLDRGAFCYVGSVHEPYLSAFVPQPEFARRLSKGWPIAAAARIQPEDRSPFAAPWRIAVVGDALWSMGPTLKRSDAPVTLEGATDLSADLPGFLKNRQYAHAFDTLAMLGRDGDAARLARAALSDEPDKIDLYAALRAVMIAYRAGDTDTLVKAGQKIDLPDQRDMAVADAIWHALWPRLGKMTQEQATLLSRTLRPYSYAWDAGVVTTALRQAAGQQAAHAFFDQARAKAPREDIKKELEAMRTELFR